MKQTAVFVGLVAVVAVAVVAPPRWAHAAEDPETEALKAHFRRVVRVLKAADASDLDPEQRAARAKHIDRLIGYGERGVFPHNTDFAEKTPYFYDHSGRACAMAYLIAESGHESAALRVAARENNAYVKQMKSPELLPWLRANGLTVDEAAMIQPAYNHRDECGCDSFAVEPAVCGSDGLRYLSSCHLEACAPTGTVKVAGTSCTGPGDFASSVGCTDACRLVDEPTDSLLGCGAGRSGNPGGALLLVLAALGLLGWRRRLDGRTRA